MAHVEEIGFGEVIERGVPAADDLPAELVYAGFSLGVMPAQKLAQTRPGARGALLFYSCVPVSEFGPAWPDGVPSRSTAWTPTRSSSARATSTPPASSSAEADDAELFLYPGDQHYFADSSLPSYDAERHRAAHRPGAGLPRPAVTGSEPHGGLQFSRDSGCGGCARLAAMDLSTFYAVVAGTCFTLVGLWWNVVERRPDWLADPHLRRLVGGVYVSFLLPP